MNLLKTKLGRTSAVIAGSIIGLAGVAVFASPASAHTPSVTGTPSCVTDAKTWTVDWKFGNDYQTNATIESVKFYALDEHGNLDRDKPLTKDQVSLDPADTVGKNVPSYSDAKAHNNEGAVEASSKISTDIKEFGVKLTLNWPQDNFTAKSSTTVKIPDTCTTPDSPTKPSTPESTPPSTPPATPGIPVPPAPAEPTPIKEMDCDTITLGYNNPKDGTPLKLEYATSKGEKRSAEVAPGDSHTEKFSAKASFSVRLTLNAPEIKDEDGKSYSDFSDIAYKQPADCDNSGQAGGLPVTGAAAGGIAGGAAVLLVAGGVLFVMARRRKVKFTA